MWVEMLYNMNSDYLDCKRLACDRMARHKKNFAREEDVARGRLFPTFILLVRETSSAGPRVCSSLCFPFEVLTSTYDKTLGFNSIRTIQINQEANTF